MSWMKIVTSYFKNNKKSRKDDTSLRVNRENLYLFKATYIPPKFEITTEPDGSCTIKYLSLDLVANNSCYDKAVIDLVNQVIACAKEYRKNVKKHVKDNNKSSQLHLLTLINKAESSLVVKELLGL